MKTAILIDGAYFLVQYRNIYGSQDAKQTAKYLFSGALKNLELLNDKQNGSNELYRIYFYDCPPLDFKLNNPISGKNSNFSQSQEAEFRLNLHQELRRLRKLELCLGNTTCDFQESPWLISPQKTNQLLNKEIQLNDLDAEDIHPNVARKGVDVRIGLQIAALAYKKLVDQIILIGGDNDFVPAAKLARDEGIDFVLDPMWKHVGDSLHEHIDGLVSSWNRPSNKNRVNANGNVAGLSALESRTAS